MNSFFLIFFYFFELDYFIKNCFFYDCWYPFLNNFYFIKDYFFDFLYYIVILIIIHLFILNIIYIRIKKYNIWYYLNFFNLFLYYLSLTVVLLDPIYYNFVLDIIEAYMFGITDYGI